jgi:hypothetical protein
MWQFKMKKYQLRFFFDGVSGDCLWSGNETTCQKFGYPIFIEDLALPVSIVASAKKLVSRYTAFAAADFQWPVSDSKSQFSLDATRFLARLKESLPDNFLVVDESGMTLTQT